MLISEDSFGFSIQTSHFHILFGSKNSNLEKLKEKYAYHFQSIKQIHKDNIVFGIDELVEADAQYTDLFQKALCITTADCVPIFICDPIQKKIAAIHAGWRGVSLRILPKTINFLLARGSVAKSLYVFIGPHIQKNSFEVDQEVKDLILKSIHTSSENLYEYKNKKYFVDLNLSIKLQLEEFEIQPDHLFDLHIDTYIDQRFHSFRRDKEISGRQLNFIVLKDEFQK